MSRRVILHLGAVKTGSSALQAALVKNRDWLKQNGYDYPASGEDEKARNHKISSGNGMILAAGLNPRLRFHKDITNNSSIEITLKSILESPQDFCKFLL